LLISSILYSLIIKDYSSFGKPDRICLLFMGYVGFSFLPLLPKIEVAVAVSWLLFDRCWSLLLSYFFCFENAFLF